MHAIAPQNDDIQKLIYVEIPLIVEITTCNTYICVLGYRDKKNYFYKILNQILEIPITFH